ncbi:MAG: hypothetical protein WC804_13860 [Sphingomonas sp.]|uniref:hypothetical protein n=1 Tax=Sphingomonas sp. TaxID=28214 RepID=UPI0035636AA6
MIRPASIVMMTSAMLFLANPAIAATCELHVWPTNRLDGATMGSWAGGIVPALMAGKTDKQVAVLKALLDPVKQVERFKKLDLRATFGLAVDTEVVYHDPIDTGWKAGARNAPSNATCYFEFRIDEIVFNRHPLYGKDILAFLTFREFGPGDTIAVKSSDRVRTKMPAFPQKVESDPASVSGAAGMVNEAFGTDITIFAGRIKPRIRKAT